jgi:small subunit ribosomal protein S16
MAVAIRLRREGNHDRPIYRIVAADSRYRRDGRFLELLGQYDPNQSTGGLNVNLEGVKAWIAKGAKPSDTVRSLIKRAEASAAKA